LSEAGKLLKEFLPELVVNGFYKSGFDSSVQYF